MDAQLRQLELGLMTRNEECEGLVNELRSVRILSLRFLYASSYVRKLPIVKDCGRVGPAPVARQGTGRIAAGESCVRVPAEDGQSVAEGRVTHVAQQNSRTHQVIFMSYRLSN